MKPFVFLVIVSFASFICHAQTITLSGKVIDSATAKPIAYVSILVANTTMGTKTDENGVYKLNDLPRQSYTLIASCLGYKARQAVVAADNGAQVIFILAQKSKELKEVNINAGDWQRNLTMFKNEFIGTTDPKDVSILNPDKLNLRYDRDSKRLSANTDDFMEIENNKLGYKLRFLVKEFWADFYTLKTHYSGQVVFEALKGKPGDERRWAKNRKDAYEGSFRHFLTSAYTDAFDKDGFDAYQFVHTPNKRRPPGALIESKLVHFRKQIDDRSTPSAGDSLRKWVNLRSLPIMDDSLGRKFTAKNLVSISADGTARIDFRNSLYIVYKKKHVGDTDDLVRFSSVASDHEIASVTIKDITIPVTFNKSGILLTRENLFFEGAWDSRIIDMLPADYKP